MGYKVLAFFVLFCAPGLCQVNVVPSNNPVAVGSNVTLDVNSSMPITVGLWLFGPSTLFMWYMGDIIPGNSLQPGVYFNSSTYQLTLSAVTLESSGVYVLDVYKPNRIRSEITLEVQEPVGNVNTTVNTTNLVEVNDTVYFTCSVTTSPVWFSWLNGSSAVKDGGRVQLQNSGQTLIINGVTRYDEGPFKCVVVNNISSQQSVEMKLNISYGPGNLTLTAMPEKTVYISGSNFSLSCSADSKPTATFNWMLNGNLLNVNGPVYVFTKATQNQSGVYTCGAQNAATLRYAAVTKTIRIVDPISEVVVNSTSFPVENVPFNLRCNVVGPVDSIQWMKDGVYLYTDNTTTLSSDNSTLSFKQLALSDDGLYQCTASNAVSDMTQAYNLTVNYGPINTAVSGPFVAAVGDSVTFSCSSNSRPQSQYSWYFNGFNVFNGPVYVTAALLQNQSGLYTCMAFNSITGKTNNNSMTLTVLVPVSNVVVNISDGQQPIFSNPFTLTCTASGNVDYIQWMLNGAVIYPQDGITFSSDNSTLSFSNLNLSDNGNYQCEASNDISNMTSTAYDLMVNYGPWNVTLNGPNMARAGSTVTFSCTADSYPASQFSWFFNSSWVGNGPVYVTAPLSHNSSGQYTCMAFNAITGSNSSSSAVQLNVIDPVSNVAVNVGNQQPVYNQPFTLTCTASGNVDYIQWVLNGTDLLPHDRITFSGDNSTLSFNNLTLSDNGHYQCEASNEISNMTSSVYDLVVNYGPWRVTINGPSMAETGSSVTFNCTADSLPASQFSWFFNSSWVGNGPVYVTAPLSQNSTGQYTCMAFNAITGINSSSSAVQLTVIDAITSVDVTPSPLIPLVSKSLQLTCNVNGPYINLYWLRNNNNFFPSNRITFSADNTTVTFSSLQTTDDGSYQCVAANAIRHHISNPYKLMVIYGPQSVQITLHPGIPPVLTCLAVSQPPSVYYWILDNNTVVGDQASITIPITSILGSNYTCVAKNPLTNLTLSISQVVSYPNAADRFQASHMLMGLLVLLFSLLQEWL
nr:novel protein similar to vertebrate titin (TTN) [Danio rerio]